MSEFSDYFESWEYKIGAFIDHSWPSSPEDAFPHVKSGGPIADASPVGGLPFAVKDNIAVKGFGLTCGSTLLAQFRSSYTATAVQRLVDAGAVPIGKTNLDEFGMGSSCDTSALKTTNNPWDIRRVAGGSSGGSAAAVAAGLVPFALGSDTGGSVRQPAMFCGVLGLKPTYGAVSRYGLVAYASSLETIGILADSVSRARDVFSVIRGPDPMDQTSLPVPPATPPLISPNFNSAPRRRIGVLSPEAVERAVAQAMAQSDQTILRSATLEPEVDRAFRRAQDELRALGHELVEVDVPTLRYGVPAYYTIATAEASANLARFDGIRYGLRPDYAENPADLVTRVRSRGFGSEVQLRILLGTFVLRSGFQDRYYLRAQRIRGAIQRDFERLLGVGPHRDREVDKDGDQRRCDCILMPVFPKRAFGRNEEGLSPLAQKAADVYTCGANLAGLPALALPVGVEEGLPVGVQLVGAAFSEGLLLDLAQEYEAAHPIQRPSGYRSYWG
jgi:aspartyl-tRNA(Asn)/glutamyl-tRNA(Gln) amidotransferase subunit A